MESQAQRLWHGGQLEQAIEWYTKALAVPLSQQWHASNRASALFLRGQLYFTLENYDAAISDFETL